MKRAPAPPAPPKPAAAPAGDEETETVAAEAAEATAAPAEIQEAAAPEVVPGDAADGASPAAPFHRDDLTLPERMELAGSKWETKLFAAMAQTDCGACGWDCEGYAEAIATGETDDISLCVPGESETLDMLQKLMDEKGKSYSGV